MTPEHAELLALVEKWREKERSNHGCGDFCDGIAHGYDMCADAIEDLLSRATPVAAVVGVGDEDVECAARALSLEKDGADVWEAMSEKCRESWREDVRLVIGSIRSTESDQPKGTSECPICGLDFLHEHNGAEVGCYQYLQSIRHKRLWTVGDIGIYDNSTIRDENGNLIARLHAKWARTVVDSHNASVTDMVNQSHAQSVAGKVEGWVLVPEEPTDWMVGKGMECHTCEQKDGYYRDEELTDSDAITIYKAMLAAAPSPHGGEG